MLGAERRSHRLERVSEAIPAKNILPTMRGDLRVQEFRGHRRGEYWSKLPPRNFSDLSLVVSLKREEELRSKNFRVQN